LIEESVSNNPWTRTVVGMTKERKAALSLMAGMFFLPLGYDVLMKMILDITGSYWTTIGIFYCLSAFFFGLHFYFSNSNPFKAITARFKRKQG